MDVKKVFFWFLFLICITANAQTNITFIKAFQIKLDPLALLYDYSRVGIGIEKKFIQSSIWAVYYYGKNLNYAEQRDYLGDYFVYSGVQIGVKKLFRNRRGEYFLGGKIGYDNSRKYMSRDVYYDLDQRFAVLFESAYYHRNRLSAFIENGYEYYLNKHLSFEMSVGAGIISIQNKYEFVRNPLMLKDIKPLFNENKYHNKIVGLFLSAAGTFGIKLGWRINTNTE